MVHFVTDAVAGARRTPGRLKNWRRTTKAASHNPSLSCPLCSGTSLRSALLRCGVILASCRNGTRHLSRRPSLVPTVAAAANASSATLRRSEGVCSCRADNRSFIFLFQTTLSTLSCARRHTGPPISARRSIHVSRTGAWMTQRDPGLDPRS